MPDEQPETEPTTPTEVVVRPLHERPADWRSRALAVRAALPQLARNPVVVGATAAPATVGARLGCRGGPPGGAPRGRGPPHARRPPRRARGGPGPAVDPRRPGDDRARGPRR